MIWTDHFWDHPERKISQAEALDVLERGRLVRRESPIKPQYVDEEFTLEAVVAGRTLRVVVGLESTEAAGEGKLPTYVVAVVVVTTFER